MNQLKFFHLLMVWVAFFVGGLNFSVLGAPIDYRSPERQAVHKELPRDSRVMRDAIALGRAGGEFTADEGKEIYLILSNGGTVPERLRERWQRLLHTAQTLSYIESLPQFFPVGYEFEVAHAKKSGWDDYEEGHKEFKKLIDETFGVTKSKLKEVYGDPEDPDRLMDYKSFFYDSKGVVNKDKDVGREWPLVTEYIRNANESEFVKKNRLDVGWEQVTPPFRQAEDLQQLAAFRYRLGRSPFGLSTYQTGLHQTNSLIFDVADAADMKLMGRIAANRLLLQAQFAPAVFETLDVRRGGAYKNKFMRPIVLDHYEMLQDIQKTDPSKLSLGTIRTLMQETYLEKEFAIQSLTDAEIPAADRPNMKNWTFDQKKGYKPNWKYRDGQLKFVYDNPDKGPNKGLNIPEKVLWELRVGDYDHERPEGTLRQSLLDQLFDQTAYKAAKEGKIIQIDIPRRPPGMSDDDYWALLKKNKKASVDAMFKTLGVTDQNMMALLQGKTFTVNEPKIPIERRAYAFEMESKSDDLVKFILPRDPKLRAEWPKMTKAQRISAMKKMGFVFDGKYSIENERILMTEFYANIDKYPFLSPDLRIEPSGNWEIKSHPRAFYTLEEMKKAAISMRNAVNLDEAWVAFHGHVFLPESEITHLKGDQAKGFAKNLERRSLGMMFEGFEEASLSPEADSRYLDSWSLDRYSPRDIEQVRNHLDGKELLSSTDQKYHNIAFRPFGKALNIEPRDNEDRIEIAAAHIEEIEASIKHGDFGDPKWNNDPPLFNEFRDHHSLKGLERYTLEGALSKHVKLTPEQKSLLHKMQFEAYRPVMGPWMSFGKERWGLNEAPNELLDIKDVRGNFENNVAMPLLNYDEQSWISAADKKRLAAAQKEYLDRIHGILKKVESLPKYSFMKNHENFLHLAEFLRRSTHPSRPDVDLLPKDIANKQREVLRELTGEIRTATIRWAKSVKPSEIVWKSIPDEKEILARKPKSPILNCEEAYRGGLARAAASAPVPTRARPRRAPASVSARQ